MGVFGRLYLDPCRWNVTVDVGNRYIVCLLDGIGAALRSQRLAKNDPGTIWQDRTLNHAYRVLGRPVVKVAAADQTVPVELLDLLTEMTGSVT